LFSTIVTGVGAAIIGGAIASVIAVTELNNSFSREAVDRATGEYPILFWGILGAGFILGTGGYIWSIAVSGQTKPSEPEKGESEKGPS
jgi:hypothetical protein